MHGKEDAGPKPLHDGDGMGSDPNTTDMETAHEPPFAQMGQANAACLPAIVHTYPFLSLFLFFFFPFPDTQTQCKHEHVRTDRFPCDEDNVMQVRRYPFFLTLTTSTGSPHHLQAALMVSRQ